MELEWVMVRTLIHEEESMEPKIEWPEDREKFWTDQRQYELFKLEFPGGEGKV